MHLTISWGWGPAWIQGTLHYTWFDVLLVIVIVEVLRRSWSTPEGVQAGGDLIRAVASVLAGILQR